MNIIKIYNKTNWCILEAIKYERMNLRDAAKRLNRSPATIHNNLKLLREFDIVRVIKKKNQYIIMPNTDNFYYRSFMQVINYETIQGCKAFQELMKMGVAGIYGSFARGTDDKNSDVDLFIFTLAKEIIIREIVNKLSRELSREINLLILNESKLKDLKNNDYAFYMRLRLESIMFNGDIFA
jgi:predicted nucleotidyltransferase